MTWLPTIQNTGHEDEDMTWLPYKIQHTKMKIWHGYHTKYRREREMFYLTTHSTHFIYGYMASDIWLRTILIVRKETRCRHIGYSYRLTARVLLYAPSHRQDNTYHSLCYTSRGALAGTRNSSMGPPHRTMSKRSTSELCPAPQNTTHKDEDMTWLPYKKQDTKTTNTLCEML